MTNYKCKIKEDKLPRERLQDLGSDRISDEELIAVIVGSGTKEAPVQYIARELLKKIDNTTHCLTLEDILSIKGLGKAKALSILAILELGKRIYFPKKRRVTSPSDILPLLSHYADRDQEYFISIALNGANEVISKHVVSMGLLNKTLVHPREVFQKAIQHRAAAIIVAHNHPSGNVEPSEEDIAITNKLMEAGNILDIRLLDHIVFSSHTHFSFLGNNLLEKHT